MTNKPNIEILDEPSNSFATHSYYLRPKSNGEKKLAESRHEMEEVARAYCKNCANFSIEAFPFKENFYPYCKKDSLIWNTINAHSDKDKKIFQGCPDNCRHYFPIWHSKIKNGFKSILSFVLKPWYWFDKQHHSIKLCLLALTIVSLLAAIYAFFPTSAEYIEKAIDLLSKLLKLGPPSF